MGCRSRAAIGAVQNLIGTGALRLGDGSATRTRCSTPLLWGLVLANDILGSLFEVVTECLGFEDFDVVGKVEEFREQVSAIRDCGGDDIASVILLGHLLISAERAFEDVQAGGFLASQLDRE